MMIGTVFIHQNSGSHKSHLQGCMTTTGLYTTIKTDARVHVDDSKYTSPFASRWPLHYIQRAIRYLKTFFRLSERCPPTARHYRLAERQTYIHKIPCFFIMCVNVCSSALKYLTWCHIYILREAKI
jgi:hypothetical protein